MDARSPLLCPDCSAPFPREDFRCRSCGFELSLPHGIPSFDPEIESTTPDSDLIEQIADLTEEKTILEATSEELGADSMGDDLLEEIYNTRNDAWRIPVSELIEGRCLDLYAGFGRRSLALAEISNTVYAVDPDLNKLRTLRYRTDFESQSSVLPIHADDRDLHLQDDAFDTVVADYTGRGRRSLKTRLESFDSTIKEDGSLLLFLDGWTRQFGAAKLLGLDRSLPSLSEGFYPLAVRQSRRFLKGLGYNSITTYTLFPTPERLLLMYKVGDSFGTSQLFETILSPDIDRPFINVLLSCSHRLGLLDHVYPTYLIVGTKKEDTNSSRVSSPVVSTGRSRSVLFESENDELESVWKYPNRRRHEAFNEREHTIVEWLKSEEPQIRQTLPEGELIDTTFGSVRKERPVTGRPLLETLDESTASTRMVLEMGLEWLLKFQCSEKRDRIVLSPDEFVERFSIPAADIEPPHPLEPVKFFETPVHGDLTPENMYVDTGNISSVIDWEYGEKAANPVIDLGFFVINCLKGSNRSTLDLMVKLVTGCPSADPIREWIHRYSEAVDIPLHTIMLLLPTVYVHRINIDRKIGADSIYTTKERQRAMIVHKVWEKYRTGST